MSSGPDPAAARAKYQSAAASYDRRLKATERYRRRAVDRLGLRPGQRVLDVACGTGVNFPLIEEQIAPEGILVGVDLSAEMLGLAARRVEAAAWRNVELVEGKVEEAQLSGPFDAALFSLTHDVLQSNAALDNVVRHLVAGAALAAFGAKWAPRWLFPVNAVVWAISRRYVTTFDGFDQPWKKLSPRVADLRVEPVALGGAYLASGRLLARRADPDS